MSEKVWTLQELKEAKVQYKKSFKEGKIDEKALNSALAKINYNIRKLNPQDSVDLEKYTLDAVVYNLKKGIPMIMNNNQIATFVKVSPVSIPRKFEEYEEKLEYLEFKKMRALKKQQGVIK
jgi:predicted RNA-binding protein (virulence factor B family)